MPGKTLAEIDAIRKGGFRPQVVACVVCDGKILFLYKEEHKLWQFAQGTLSNKETTEQALEREMRMELGDEFMNNCFKTFTYIGEDEIEFPPHNQNTRELITDDGENIFMKGKHYFFYLIETEIPELNINETEFDDFEWLDAMRATVRAQEIYQRGKRRITSKAVNILLGGKKIH